MKKRWFDLVPILFLVAILITPGCGALKQAIKDLELSDILNDPAQKEEITDLLSSTANQTVLNASDQQKYENYIINTSADDQLSPGTEKPAVTAFLDSLAGNEYLTDEEIGSIQQIQLRVSTRNVLSVQDKETILEIVQAAEQRMLFESSDREKLISLLKSVSTGNVTFEEDMVQINSFLKKLENKEPFSLEERLFLRELIDSLSKEVTLEDPKQRFSEDALLELLEKHALGINHLKKGEIVKAIDIYEAIYAINETDPTANFVLAWVAFIKIIEDPTFQDIIKTYEEKTGSSLDYPKTITDFMDRLPTVTEMEISPDNFEYYFKDRKIYSEIISVVATINAAIEGVYSILEDVLLPAIKKSKHHLNILRNHEGFSLLISKEITDSDQDTIITKADINYAYSALCVFNIFIHSLTAYDLQLSNGLTIDDFDSTEAFLNANPQFGTLRDREHMIAVLTNLKHFALSAIHYIDLCIDSINNGKPAGVTAQNFDVQSAIEMKKILTQFQNILSGELLTISVPTTEETTTEIKINIVKFFTNPITDIRDYLGLDFESDTAPEGFDFTVQGIFPEISSFEEFKKLVGLLSFYLPSPDSEY